MQIRAERLIQHLPIIFGLILILLVATVYPFLPGSHDALAVALSSMVQALAVIGLLPAFIGILWLAYEWRKRARARQNLPHRMKAYGFAWVSLLAGTVPMLVVTAA